MARVSYIELEGASPEVREVYEKTLKGKPGSVQRILAHRPDMLKNFLAFYASVDARWSAPCMSWCTSASR